MPPRGTSSRIGSRTRRAITEEVVRAEIRKAAVERRTGSRQRELPSFGQVKQAERGLIWAVFHEPEAGLAALGELEDERLGGLGHGPILRRRGRSHETPVQAVPAGAPRASKYGGGRSS